VPARDSGIIVVMTNMPDRASALALARELVERKLAACVNVMGECASTYRWRGAIEQAAEVPVFIKAAREAYAPLEQAIRALHPYELPEIVAVPVVAGLADYLDWVATPDRPESSA
jgi:periplasmic divalent cation tolerance protein